MCRSSGFSKGSNVSSKSVTSACLGSAGRSGSIHLHFRGDSSRKEEDSHGDQRANSGLWVWRRRKEIRFDICLFCVCLPGIWCKLQGENKWAVTLHLPVPLPPIQVWTVPGSSWATARSASKMCCLPSWGTQPSSKQSPRLAPRIHELVLCI